MSPEQRAIVRDLLRQMASEAARGIAYAADQLAKSERGITIHRRRFDEANARLRALGCEEVTLEESAKEWLDLYGRIYGDAFIRGARDALVRHAASLATPSADPQSPPPEVP